MNAKESLKELFLFAIFKLDNGDCTPEEYKSWADAAMSNVDMQASIKELADFFGVSEHNVRSTINRKMLAKPKRRVVYPFKSFMEVAPESWHNRRLGKVDQEQQDG